MKPGFKRLISPVEHRCSWHLIEVASTVLESIHYDLPSAGAADETVSIDKHAATGEGLVRIVLAPDKAFFARNWAWRTRCLLCCQSCVRAEYLIQAACGSSTKASSRRLRNMQGKMYRRWARDKEWTDTGNTVDGALQICWEDKPSFKHVSEHFSESRGTSHGAMDLCIETPDTLAQIRQAEVIPSSYCAECEEEKPAFLSILMIVPTPSCCSTATLTCHTSWSYCMLETASTFSMLMILQCRADPTRLCIYS